MWSSAVGDATADVFSSGAVVPRALSPSVPRSFVCVCVWEGKGKVGKIHRWKTLLTSYTQLCWNIVAHGKVSQSYTHCLGHLRFHRLRNLDQTLQEKIASSTELHAYKSLNQPIKSLAQRRKLLDTAWRAPRAGRKGKGGALITGVPMNSTLHVSVHEVKSLSFFFFGFICLFVTLRKSNCATNRTRHA